MAGDKKYTKSLLTKKTVAELTELWTDTEGRDITDFDDDFKKADLIEALLEIEEGDEEEELDDELDEEEEPEVEDEAELDDEEEDLELPDEEEEDDIEEEAPKPTKKSRAKAKKSDDEGDGSGTLAAKQVATLLGTEAKTLRQFFRSPASTIEAVGSGGRYEFNESDLPTITKEFEAWKSGHAARGNKRTGEGGTSSRKSRKAAAAAPVIEEIEELEIEDLEDEELELEDED